MTDRWVSQGRHYCKLCNCWLSKHAVTITAHENSERHVRNKERQVRDLYRADEEKRQRNAEIDAELARMDAAARLSLDTIASLHVAAAREHATKKAKVEYEVQELIKHMPGTKSETAEYSTKVELSTDLVGGEQWVATVDAVGKSVWHNTQTGAVSRVNPTVAPADRAIEVQKKEYEMVQKVQQVAELLRQKILKDRGVDEVNASTLVPPAQTEDEEKLDPEVLNASISAQPEAGTQQDAIGRLIAARLNAKTAVHDDEGPQIGEWQALPISHEIGPRLATDEELAMQEELEKAKEEMKEEKYERIRKAAREAGVNEDAALDLVTLRDELTLKNFLSADDLHLQPPTQRSSKVTGSGVVNEGVAAAADFKRRTKRKLRTDEE